MKKRIISLILLVIMAIPAFAVHSSADPIGNIEENVNVTTVSNYNKLHFYFDNEEHATIDSKSELVSAMNALANRTTGYEIYNAQNADDFNDDLHITVEFASDFTSTAAYQAFAEEAQTLTTSDEVLDFRQRLNAFSLKYHASLVKENLDYLSVFGDATVQTSMYSPFVTLIIEPDDLTEQSLTALCSTNDVANISLSYELVAEPAYEPWSNCMDATNASSIINNSTYTGEGVRIGVYEALGVCDTSHENLSDKDITKHGLFPTVDDHATEVTSIIALMAPDAEFYVSKVTQPSLLNGNRSYSDLDWFIQNNCDIINCSFGALGNIKQSNGTYTKGPRYYRNDVDGIFDYYVRAYFVTICVCSYNLVISNTKASYNPNSEITSPGYAYNVITVGGVENTNPYWRQADGAAYVCNTAQAKPNVSAPYYVNIPNIGAVEGTSYATPIVVGCIALLEDSNSSYKAQPHRVMSVVTSTATETFNYMSPDGMNIGNFDTRVGAGIVNLTGMLNNINHTIDVNSGTSNGSIILDETVVIQAGEKIQAAVAWLITTNRNANSSASSVTSQYVTDYELKLYNSSGALLKSSTLSFGNVELLRYDITETDVYRIVVSQYGSINSYVDYDYIALTYNVN